MWVDQEYHLNHDVVDTLQQNPVPWGGGILSQATFYRTYSRVKDDGGQEHFHDVVQRNVEGVMSIRKSWYKLIGRRWDREEMDRIAERMAIHMYSMKFLPPGRGLYAMKTDFINARGNAALNNCGFVNVNSSESSLSDAAYWLMDQLMLGVGVGFRVPTHGVGHSIRPTSGPAIIFQIPDTREGWAESVRLLIDSYEVDYNTPNQLETKQPIIFDYSVIRPAGSPIKTFGGIASGPAPLEKLHQRIREKLDAETQSGYYYGSITTELIADVMNMIGDCVIAGNVRRSAEIAIGSPNDDVFINLKNYGKWDSAKGEWATIGPYHHRLPWGYMSNNSVWLDTDKDFEAIPDLVKVLLDRGEPGFINGKNIKNRGRYQDKVGADNPWLRPDNAIGMNPCGEIPLEDRELCNLIETFPTRVASLEEWHEVLSLATFYASTVALLPSHDSSTNEVVARNRRIGVSVSGVADWLDSTSFSKIHRWLDSGYNTVRRENRLLAEDAGVPTSVRLTTVKPSGTVSLLPWVSPGMHHPVKNRFIRRITFRQNDPVAERLIKAGVPYEPLATDPTGSWSFQFPMESANRGRTRSVEHVPISEQVALACFLARVWADNSVSFTGTVSKKEIPYLERVITMGLPQVKALSFLVNQEDDKQYEQAPYEAITLEEFEKRHAAIDHNIDWSDYGGTDGIDNRYCDGDVCEIPGLSTAR
jgi:ribonucleoside-triphosphate reductase